MEYIKFEIDELTNNSVFCQYREITEEGKGPLLQRSFPLEKIGPEVPKIPDMVKGTITNIYYEQRGDFIITEKKDINNIIVPLTEEEINLSLTGIWFRMNDKIQRIKNLLMKGRSTAVDESIEDAFLDLSNYGIMATLVKEGKWGK